MEALYNALVDKDLDACEKGFEESIIIDVDNRCKADKLGKTVLVLVAEATSGVEHDVRERWSAFADKLINQGSVHVEQSLRLAIDKKYDDTVIIFLLKKFIPFCSSNNDDNNNDSPYAMSLKWLTLVHSEEQQCSQGSTTDREDVIMDALKRSKTLRKEAVSQPKLRAKKETHSKDLEQFAADLVEECNENDGTDAELKKIMGIKGEGEPWNNEQRLNSMTVITEATIMRMKLFVASPRCQHFLKTVINAPEYTNSCLDFLSSKWGTKQSRVFDEALIWVVLWFILSAIIYVSTFPIVFILYCLVKCFSVRLGCSESNSGNSRSQWIQWILDKFEHPHYKFINHTMFYAIFLSLILASAFEENFPDIKTNWGLSNLHIAIFTFVVGYTLDVFAKAWCRYKKPRPALQGYWSSHAYFLYVLTTSLFLVSYILWICAWKADNESWIPDDKLFGDSDILYSIACVLAFLRITRILRAHRKLGTLELSLANMLYDVWYFGFLFFFLYISFAVGIRKLYSYHVTATKEHHEMSKFLPTLEGLFWLVIGVLDMDAYETSSFEYIAVQTAGKIMVATYTILSILVAMNMLIALMTRTCERIQTNQDTEWAFARTQMWLEYLDDREKVLPPPLNVLELPARIVYQLYRIFRSCCESCCTRRDGHRRMSDSNDYQETGREMRPVGDAAQNDSQNKAQQPASERDSSVTENTPLLQDDQQGQAATKRQDIMRKLIVRYLKKKLNSELRREGDQATELSRLRKDMERSFEEMKRHILEESTRDQVAELSSLRKNTQLAMARGFEEMKRIHRILEEIKRNMGQEHTCSRGRRFKRTGSKSKQLLYRPKHTCVQERRFKKSGPKSKKHIFETDEAACVDSEAVESEPSDDCRN